MTKCYKCSSKNIIKNGKKPDGRQKYRCKDCNSILTENTHYKYFTDEEKEFMIKIYERKN